MKIEKINESHLRVYASREVQQEIKDFFTFKAPGYRFHPKYKAKLWDGNISLYNMQTCKLPLGLHDLLISYAEKTECDVEYIGDPIEEDDISLSEIQEFVSSLKLSNGAGEPIEAKDYQIEAVWKSLRKRRLCLSMPTGSGKSLTIYIIIRWLLAHEKRICLIVPSQSLVRQMLSDFIEYSIINEFEIEKFSNLLYSGQEKNFEPPILISTWQSLAKMVKLKHGVTVINSYDAIIVDEAHTAKGTELQKILELADDVPYKIGTTGTVDKEKISELTIIGSMGPVEKIITTKELMDAGSLSNMIIKSVILQYSEETSKKAKSFSYDEEKSFICAHEKRNKLIATIALNNTGTTMILCSYVESHLIPLYEAIKERAEALGKEVFAIHGGIPVDERERIRQYAIKTPGVILVCSYQTCQAGINIPNIENVVFAAPSKSMIRVLQSIGRGLRKSSEKEIMTLFDIVDDMRYRKHENTVFKHFLERMKIYRAEKFDIEMIEFKMKD